MPYLLAPPWFTPQVSYPSVVVQGGNDREATVWNYKGLNELL